MKISEILAKLTGSKNDAGETVSPTLSVEELNTMATALQARETELTAQATELEARNAELVEKEAGLNAKETELTEKETGITAKETELTTKETDLSAKETAIADREAALNAATAPVKPESKENTLEAYAAEKNPAKKFQLFRKNKAALLKK